LSQEHGKNVFNGPSGPDSVRTGDPAIDGVLDILRADGFLLHDMAMPFPLVIMGFRHADTDRVAVVIFKDGDQPVTTPGGLLVTESVVMLGHAGDGEDPPAVPVRKFLADRGLPCSPAPAAKPRP
jgi:hypothetical protein